MTNFKRLVWLSVFLLPIHAAVGNDRYDSWQADRPLTLTAWATHPAGGGQTDVDYFRGTGLNTFWDGVRSGSSSWQHPQSHGLPVLLMVQQAEQPDLSVFLADLKKAQAVHDNLVGFVLGDEVKSTFGQGGLEHMRAIRDWVVENPDPTIRGLVTVTSVPSGEKVSSTEHVRQYWDSTYDTVRPDAWLPQFYPFGGGQLDESYYSSLQWYADWATPRDLVMWTWTQTWASSPQSVPSESQLRLQRYSSLAYGVKGFADFLWNADGSPPSVQGAGYWDGSGEPTEMCRQLASINAEVARIGRAMVNLTPVRAYHMDSRNDGDGVHHWSDSDDDLPVWLRRMGKLANVTGAANGNHVLVGFFRDDAGREYFMVVNKDHAAGKDADQLTTPITLTFHPSVRTIQRLRRDDGEVETIPVQDNYQFDLPGGTGDLFAIGSDGGFAGVIPLDLPKLLSAKPANRGTWGRLGNNELRLHFDRDATRVSAQITADDDNAHENLAEHFTRRLSDDGRTLIYRERGTVLVNHGAYGLKLHWADAAPQRHATLRGDVNGDGALSPEDVAAVEAVIAGRLDPTPGADLDGDGQVDDRDLRLARRATDQEPFRWTETFEAYPAGDLTGRGGWREAGSLPGSVLSAAWVGGSAVIASPAVAIQGKQLLHCTDSNQFFGNEARFVEGDGFDSVGTLRYGFQTRLGHHGFQNNGVHIWNTRDIEGNRGGLTIEVVRGALTLRGTRGVTLDEGVKDMALPTEATSPAGRIIHVEVRVDFDRALITWRCRVGNKMIGSSTVPYRGTLQGLDGISVILRGEGSQLDQLWVQSP